MRWWAGPKMIRPTSFWFRDFGIRTAKPGSCPLRLDPTSPTSVCDSWWPWGLRRWKMSTGQADFLQKLHTILYRYTMIYYDILIYIYYKNLYVNGLQKMVWRCLIWRFLAFFDFFLNVFVRAVHMRWCLWSLRCCRSLRSNWWKAHHPEPRGTVAC